MKIPIEKETLEMVISILVHNRGDGRQCPFCNNMFIPEDVTAFESFEMYKKIKKEMEKYA